MVASIDHMNAPLLWDHSKLAKFNWVWQDCTTFASYSNETSYNNSLTASTTALSVRGSCLSFSSKSILSVVKEWLLRYIDWHVRL